MLEKIKSKPSSRKSRLPLKKLAPRSRDIAQKHTLFELMVLNGIPNPETQRGIGHLRHCSKLKGNQLHAVLEQTGDFVFLGGDQLAEDVVVDGSKRKLEVGGECS